MFTEVVEFRPCLVIQLFGDIRRSKSCYCHGGFRVNNSDSSVWGNQWYHIILQLHRMIHVATIWIWCNKTDCVWQWSVSNMKQCVEERNVLMRSMMKLYLLLHTSKWSHGPFSSFYGSVIGLTGIKINYSTRKTARVTGQLVLLWKSPAGLHVGGARVRVLVTVTPKLSPSSTLILTWQRK